MSRLILLEITQDGKQTERLLEPHVAINAGHGSTYSILNAETKRPPEELELYRQGNDLEVRVDGEPVGRITGFFSDGVEVTFSVDGSATPASDLAVYSTDPAIQGDGVVWQASDSDVPYAEIGVGTLGGAALLGGGGGAAAPGFTLTVAAVAGPFTSDVAVHAYDADGNLIGEGSINPETGQARIRIREDYTGPVLVEVVDTNGSDSDYVDETTGLATSLGGTLRAMGYSDGGRTLNISVTPLTELAVRQAGVTGHQVTEEDLAANQRVADLFGVEDILAPVTTILDEDYDGSDGIDAAEHYGNVLAQLSGADSVSGDIDTTLDLLQSQIVEQTGGDLALTQEGIELLQQGVDAFEAGVNGDSADLTDALIEPPVVDAASGGLNAQEVAAGVSVQVAGVVVDDVVTILWGSEQFDVTVTSVDDDGVAQLDVPQEVISAAGDGTIAVSYQVNSGDESPAAIITVDTSVVTFSSASEADAIDENSGAAQGVYTAVASDSDADVLAYSLKGTGDDALFSIDSSTGEVTLTGNPDHETKSSYSFTVVATDAAGNSDEQAVSLSINDLDESDPVITSGSTATAIDENSGAGQVVYDADADDSGDISGGVSFSLKGTGDDALFSIDSSTGEVTLTGNPDYETKSSYSFTVVATDAAGNSDEQAVSLSINDLDESDPVISSASSATAIDENSGAGQVVYTATATDTADTDDATDTSASLTYSLKGTGDDALFSIDSSTGEVTLTGNPDHETKSSYSFTVVATDAAGNSDEQAVSLSINDLDESAPVISSASSATAIDENSGAGQVVYTATATDTADSDDATDTSASLTYSLKGTGDDALFSIDSSTGEVTLTGNPDHETKSSYSFTVVATDAAGNSDEQAVSLSINDLDESDPVISSASSATAIDENSGAGQVVYTATATDTADSDDATDTSASLTYSLKGTGDDALFSIDSSTGEVTLTGNPDHETKSSYSFTVVATDAAGNSDEQAVSLSINDLDESDPVISSASSATAIDENSGAGQVVYTATATDTADSDDATDTSASLTYSLKGTGDDALFSINSSTGAVTLTGNPDYETKSSYSFTVVATDTAGNSDEQAVSLAINDLTDEVAPTITSVAISGATGAQNNYLNAGDMVSVTVTLDEATVVTGTPQLALNIGGTTVQANYASGSGSTALVFSYTIQAAQSDADGISIDANSLSLNGGTLKDAAGNAITMTHNAVAANASYMVDTTAPTASVTTATIDNTENAVVQSSETGTAYLVKDSVTVNSLSDITSAADGSWNSVTISNANTNTNLAATGLDDGTYNVYTVDAAGNLSSASSNAVTISSGSAETATVVFDYVGGVSSNHSSRTFDSGTTYTIYIHVPTDLKDSTTTTQSGYVGNWGSWSGGGNLGTDDKIILVGSGQSYVYATSSVLFSQFQRGTRLRWLNTTAITDHVFIQGNGYIGAGLTGGDSQMGYDMWSGTWAGVPNATVAGWGQAYMSNLPAGVLTSQGLV